MTIPAVDSHVHIWDRTRGETFIAEQQFPALIDKAFMPEDLAPILAATNADSAVLVHGPATVEHAMYCLELCHRHPMFRSVIGWVDLRARDCADQLARQAGDPAFRGVRFTPLLDPEPAKYLQSDAARATCASLRDHGAIVEILAPPIHAAAVGALAAAYPDLNVVLAHFGLPDENPDSFPAWRATMQRLARYPNLHVKLSGLPLAGHRDPGRDQTMTRDHLNVMLDLFAANRLLYASNWPVATAMASPAYWRDLLDQALQDAGIAKAEKAAIYRDNAERLY
ncbi:amidohydrolase family protein [Paracoccus sp. Z330]|uniref:Amidohydrolase family protein n=1 Tax=Paracoccus onchidii TaxID=3017813 RepID=A0ABT4ZIU0_9RHOB|nr:amidohydrolase family protein [Paracoccus onchidii]MDB6179119.1 amidohydrolase family protein [Paracoccus onchidii]